MNLNLSRGALGATFLTGAFVALLGCTTGEGTGGAGGATSSTGATKMTTTGASMTTTGASMTTTGASMTTTGSSSSSGTGGASDAPTFSVTKIGNPLWEPVDFHEASVPMGNMFENFTTIVEGIMPPPNHAHHAMLGVGPGAAHAGPYTGEMGAGFTAEGYVDHQTYTEAEGSLPNAVLVGWMVVPTAGAPMGLSPDGAMTPIIPNTIFPISVGFDSYENNMLLDGYSYGFNVPPLDSTLNPQFNVDGHSHFPLFDATYFDGMPTYPGTLETRIHMEDTNGDGYDIIYTVVGVP